MSNKKDKISTFQPFDFESRFIDNLSSRVLLKENVNEFFIHSLEDEKVQLILPLPPHRKTVNDFMFIVDGCAERQLGIEYHSLTKNDFVWVPKLSVSTTEHYSTDLKGFYCHFSDDFIEANSFFLGWRTDTSLTSRTRVPEETARRIILLLSEIVELYNNSWESHKDVVSQYLKAVLLEIYIVAKEQLPLSNKDTKKSLTSRYIRLINSDFKKQSSIADFAKRLNVSPNHLNKTVKDGTGKTAQEIRNEVLLQEAKVKLIQTIQNVGEVAFELGFNDSSYFGKFFKKQTGMTPLEYRKMVEKTR